MDELFHTIFFDSRDAPSRIAQVQFLYRLNFFASHISAFLSTSTISLRNFFHSERELQEIDI